MKSYLIKASVAAAMLVAGTLAQAADNTLAVSVAPGTAVQGGVSTSLMTIHLDGSYLLEGATFNLDWDAATLTFLPLQSTAASMSYGSLVGLFDPDSFSMSSDPGIFGLSGFLLAPQAVEPGDVALTLAFQGLQVGTHAVTYYLELADLTISPPLANASSFNITITPVPEPATYALMLGGLAVVGALARRRSRAA